jgi:hypothetical protein
VAIWETALVASVDAGADLGSKNSAWGGTPLAWAEHYLSEGQGDRGKQYSEIATYLRAHDGHR